MVPAPSSNAARQSKLASTPPGPETLYGLGQEHPEQLELQLPDLDHPEAVVEGHRLAGGIADALPTFDREPAQLL